MKVAAEKCLKKVNYTPDRFYSRAMFQNILGPKYEELQTFLRSKMTEGQLKQRGIKDTTVLAAMNKVKRHLFVPEYLRARSYEDYPLPIAGSQTISQPYIAALMTELLGVGAGQKVLEIGTGSGYQTAILSELGCEVYSVEILPELSAAAGRTLKSLGYRAVNLKTGDGRAGWPQEAPFDGILAACAAESVPDALLRQLKTGARLVMPIGPERYQTLKVFSNTAAGITQKDITPVTFVPMTGGGGEK